MPGILSQRLYDDHYQLYRGYVEKVETLLNKPLATREWSRDFNYAYAGARLHSLYFEQIDSSAKANPNMLEVIAKSFGSLGAWSKELTELCKTCRPAGWAMTCLNTYNGELLNIAFDSHDQLIPDMKPLIVIDMFEHAYLIDWDLDKDAYIKAVIKSLNWDLVWKRFKVATSS